MLNKFNLPKLDQSKLKDTFAHFSRGGPVLMNEANLLIEKLGFIAAIGFIGFLATVIPTAWLLTGSNWNLYWRYNLARIVDAIGGGSVHMWGFTSKSGQAWSATDFVSQYGAAYHEIFWFRTPIICALSLVVMVLIWKSITKAFVKRGVELKDEFLRGAVEVSQADLNASVAKTWDALEAAQAGVMQKLLEEGIEYEPLPPKYTFGGVTIPPRKAQRNFLATGGMGSGKSVAIFDLYDQVTAARRKRVTWDRKGEFAEFYYDPWAGDVFFNPLDKRFCEYVDESGNLVPGGWNLFSEIADEFDFDQMALYWIPPKGKAGDNDHFDSGARTIVSSMLRKLWEEGKTDPKRRTNEALWDAILKDKESLANWLQGTPAADYYGEDAGKNGGAACHSVVKEKLKVLQYVPSGNFSLKKFIHDGKANAIYLVSKEQVHEVIKPLTALAMNIMISAVMEGERTANDKFWFFIDEFKSLGALPMLGHAITLGRSYGMVTVIGAQGTHQFDVLGEDVAKDVRSNLGTQLTLRVADEETTEKYSKNIGEAEYNELSDSSSWKVDNEGGGGSVSRSRKSRRVVMASEIKTLPDCTGYLQLPDNMPIAKVTYVPKARKTKNQPWIKRDGLQLDTATMSHPAAVAEVSEAVTVNDAPEVVEEIQYEDPTVDQAGHSEADSTSTALDYFAAMTPPEESEESTQDEPESQSEFRAPLLD